ncbi:MAG: hypothetical protein ACRDGV_02025 [Candidatus Limnocylindria bacterium]
MRGSRSTGALLVAMLLLAGCATKFSGGGFMPSATAQGKATFGFTFECAAPDDCSDGRMQGAYHDRAADVRFRFTGIVEASAEPGFSDNCMGGTMAYTSQGVDRGSGEVMVLACDAGRGGPSAGDTLTILVMTGPYGGPPFGNAVFPGYANSATLEGGNLRAHD